MLHSDLKYYETFNKFFTRKLKEGVRKITKPFDKNQMASPCDGRVLTCGEVNSSDSTIDCVKGRSYRLDEFLLGHKEEEKDSSVQSIVDKVKERGNKLFYTVIYLAPSDYHRFHSASFSHIDFRRHIVGYLDPVKPAYVNKHKDVFKNNERVNLFGSWAQGFFMTSFVGALNVGSIKLNFDSTLKTNTFAPTNYEKDKAYSK